MTETGKWLLFAGEEFYPGGGEKDFKGAFSTRNDAELAAHSYEGWQWRHIYDVESGLWYHLPEKEAGQ